jgi:2-C-methyl-D-erythritol 2,4-cyclodiphosphate synthase
VLGGVRVGDTGGLLANSDGDVILHALFNAISQACGGDSIGVYADPLLRQGITDSRAYLRVPLDMARELGYRVHNVGIMVEALSPRLPVPVVARMRRSIADLVGVEEGCVGLTFTSGERLTAFGRGRGVLAQAVVSLVRA